MQSRDTVTKTEVKSTTQSILLLLYHTDLFHQALSFLSWHKQEKKMRHAVLCFLNSKTE